MTFSSPPPPRTPLGIYRLLAPQAGVRVSPLCLGGMNFGDSWKHYMGECGKDQTFAILDHFYKAGGNFIDTANNYQREESEMWIGEWMEARKNRDQMVIATKYTTCYRESYGDTEILVNATGNSAKSLHTSVHASLKKLKTDYIDLLYVHWWDYTTSVEEVMQSLNVLVQQGKVLYLGISDTPAWIIVKANAYARANGLRPFSVWQGRWSAEHRDVERDVIDMCKSEGMAMAPWGVLGGGNFKTAKQREAAGNKSRREGRDVQIMPSTIAISSVLERVAERKGTLLTSVALAYVLHKAPHVFPIIGGRNIEHLKGNIDALTLELSKEDIAEIEAAKEFDYGLPRNIFGKGPDQIWLMNMAEPIQFTKAQIGDDVIGPINKSLIPKKSESGTRMPQLAGKFS